MPCASAVSPRRRGGIVDHRRSRAIRCDALGKPEQGIALQNHEEQGDADQDRSQKRKETHGLAFLRRKAGTDLCNMPKSGKPFGLVFNVDGSDQQDPRYVE